VSYYKENNLVAYYYLNAPEIWPNQRSGLWLEELCKRGNYCIHQWYLYWLHQVCIHFGIEANLIPLNIYI